MADSNMSRSCLFFSQNIEYLRQNVFAFRYVDVTTMTSLPETTMVFYGRGVSPGISVADQISRLFCLPLSRLCLRPVSDDIELQIFAQIRFLRMSQTEDAKHGLISLSSCRRFIVSFLDSFFSQSDNVGRISAYDLLCVLRDSLSELISSRLRDGIFFRVEKDDAVVTGFTKNFAFLHDVTGTSYRRLGSACDISIGNLARLQNGAEPKLSSALRIADFYGVGIRDLLSADADFNTVYVIMETMDKTSIADVSEDTSTSGSDAVSARQEHLKNTLISSDAAATTVGQIFDGFAKRLGEGVFFA